MKTDNKNPLVIKIFIITLILLIGLGIVMQYSASNKIALEKTGKSYYFLLLHLKHLLMGILICITFLFIDYKQIKKTVILLFVITLLIVIVPIIKKVTTNSSSPARWFSIGSSSIQTSEVARLFLIIFLANYITKHNFNRITTGLFISIHYILYLHGYSICWWSKTSTHCGRILYNGCIGTNLCQN
jgi:cell division protein FtsW